MVQLLSLLTPLFALAGFVAAAPTGKGAEPIVTYLGSQGPILCKRPQLFRLNKTDSM